MNDEARSTNDEGRTKHEIRKHVPVVGAWCFGERLLFALLALAVRPAARDRRRVASVRFRESVAIDTDLTAQRQLELARIHLAEKRWSEGIDLIRQAAANAPGSLVTISPGRYLNVDLYAQLLLASLPPEGLAVARKAIDESARQAFEEAVRNRDEAALRALVRDSFVSRAADDALMTLGQWAWEAGDLTKARGELGTADSFATVRRRPARRLRSCGIPIHGSIGRRSSRGS